MINQYHLIFTTPRPPPPHLLSLIKGTTDSGHYYAYIKDKWSLPVEARARPSATNEGVRTEEGKVRHLGGSGDVEVAGVGGAKASPQSSSLSMSEEQMGVEQRGQGLGSGPGVGSGSGSGKEGCCRWLEFNDSEVTEFSESRLDAECFGGTTISHDFHKDTKVGHK